MTKYFQFPEQKFVCKVEFSDNDETSIAKFENTGNVECKQITLSQYRRLKMQYRQDFEANIRL